MLRSMVPSPPRLTSSADRSTSSGTSTDTALQSIRPTSSGKPSTVTWRVVAQLMIVSIAGDESRRGCSTSPTV